MGKVSTFILFGGLTVALILAAFILTRENLPKFKQQESVNTVPQILKSQETADKKPISYTCQPGKSAFEILEQSNNVEFKGSSFGRFITKINGVEQGEGKYWLYLVDGREATVSADSYVCQGREQIKWELK